MGTGGLWETLTRLGWLCAAGAAGTVLRYSLAAIVQRFCGPGFPWGTLTVNALGCFLFGLLWTLAEERLVIGPQVRLIALTGFMGAFTTFSTFAYETSELLRAAEWATAVANFAGQNVLGIACVFLGFALGRLL
jgi:CrcB protein